ncbi:3-oxoadipate enol-lactonase [Nocardiopsis mwathae]|uniref:3-oxoadipate enol-lactonase n=1 Tax=Nocardiopsis mwathae TaxID=1472723 RepID=A0A7X0D790_9ACTN|nr:alpha/beta fold hydrolase [Nocardiopsis mwathae]MBB6174095.1 3-oxoadipate enol-lactonase [Nocardiopsis mwathae]
MTVVPLHYRFDGSRHAPVALLIPPLGTKWSVWEPQMPELTRTLRVLRVNHRGHGATPAPEGPYTLDDLGNDVLAVLDGCGLDRYSVIGAGTGGALATWVALSRPAQVRRLAYVAGTTGAPPAVSWSKLADQVLGSGMAAVSAETTRAWFTPWFVEERPDVVARLVAEFEGISPVGYAGHCAALDGLDQRLSLARIRVSTLVLSAAHDPFLPPGHGRRLADAIPGARFEVIPRAAHLVGIERAERVNELLMAHVGG